MTPTEYKSYRFDPIQDPSDEQLDQIMENAAAEVRRSNRESEEKFFAELKRLCDEAKERAEKYSKGEL